MRKSEKSDWGKAAGRFAGPTQKQTVKPPRQKREQVEHTAGRFAEPVEACGTQLEHDQYTDSSDSRQVDGEVHRAGQLRAPEEDGEEQDEQEHCNRA